MPEENLVICRDKQMKVRLGNYIKEYSVRNKKDEDIPVYSVTNTQGFCQDYFGKEVASKDKTTYKIVPRGYFAFNPSRINVGSVDWQRNEERVIVSPLYNVFSVSEQLDQQYLYYYLKSDFALQRIIAVIYMRKYVKVKMNSPEKSANELIDRKQEFIRDLISRRAEVLKEKLTKLKTPASKKKNIAKFEEEFIPYHTEMSQENIDYIKRTVDYYMRNCE